MWGGGGGKMADVPTDFRCDGAPLKRVMPTISTL